MNNSINSVNQIKILGLGGSLNSSSNTIKALDLALASASEAGAKVERLNFADMDLPFFVPRRPLEVYTQAEAIREYLEKVQQADAIIFSAPIYHGTISGLWKNGIDFLELLPREAKVYLDGKPIGLIAVSGGPMAAHNGITALEHTAAALRATVAGRVAIGAVRRILDGNGLIIDAKVLADLEILGQQLVASVKGLQTLAA